MKMIGEKAHRHAGQMCRPTIFSARYIGYLIVEEQSFYRFDVLADDGVRMYIAGDLAIDHWHATPNAPHSATRTLAPGRHTLVVEYREAVGNARVFVDIEAIEPREGDWYGEYYNNPDLAGAPSVTRYDAAPEGFGYGNADALSLIPADNFSVRWTKQMQFSQPQQLAFTVTADDGVRIWVSDTFDFGSMGQSRCE